MTPIEAKKITLEIWRYLAKHPKIRCKYELPDKLWIKIHGFHCGCALCELFRSDYTEPICPKCPLESCVEGSLYGKWFSLRHFSEQGAKALRKEVAQRIVDKVKAWMPEDAA